MAVGAVGSSSGGDAFAALAEQWNGSSWSIQSIPSPTGAQSSWLYGLSCVSSTSCTAVGTTDGGPLAEHWDGSSWSIQSTPDGGDLVDVSCTSATACTAVGSYGNGTLAERWDGSSWSTQSTPNPTAQYSELVGVSCSSAMACTAVGDYTNSSGAGGTLAEHWDGSSWSMQSTPNPAGAQSSQLTGVSCFSSNACTAVGDYANTTAGGTLAERWDGSSWSIQSTPNPGGSGNLNRVSCSSATACTAVGQYSSSTGMMLAEGWDGSSWSIQSVPSPTGVQGGELIGVSCLSANACTAVGIYDDSGGPALALQESWNGTSWQVPGSDDGAVSGIVTDAATHTPIQNMEVDVYSSGGAVVASTCTAADGTYTVSGLAADTYHVGFTPSLVSCTGPSYAPQFYDNEKSLASADPVAVAAGSTTSAIDAAMVSNAVQISGTVPGATTPGITAAPTPNPMPAKMPVITSLSESHRTFREADKLATITRAKHPPMGTTFSFALNAASTVKLSFTQSRAGRKVKGKCVARTKANERKHSCERTVVVGRLSDRATAGLHRVHFEGRVSASRKLKPGHYKLVMTAIDAAGQSHARSISFTIVK